MNKYNTGNQENLKITVSIVFLAVLIAACFIGPFLIDYGEYEIFYSDDGQKVLSLQPVSGKHLLGTDKKGHDIMIRLLYGGRISLTLALSVVILQTILGVGAGLLAGYMGKKTDMILMRITDILNALPDIIIILILSSLMVAYGISGKYRIFLLMLFLAAFGWTFIAKIVRSQILYLRESPYMLAAELCGIPTWRRLVIHLLPNVIGKVAVAMPVSIGNIILTEATLSFLGFGLSYPYSSWGNMLNAALEHNVLNYYPNVWLPPGLLILLTVAAFHILGSGLKKRRDSTWI